MKTRRIVTSLALAAAVSLGLTSCGLFVPQATLEPYAPSDGIEVTIEEVAVRNLLLVADEENENFNVVFSGVNNGQSAALLRMTFVSSNETSRATADFLVEPGRTLFGEQGGEPEATIVSIRDLAAGDTVTAFIEVAGVGEVERQVPVLNGTLAEYKPFVPRG